MSTQMIGRARLISIDPCVDVFPLPLPEVPRDFSAYVEVLLEHCVGKLRIPPMFPGTRFGGKQECVRCGQKIPPGRAGRKCAACRTPAA
jgi:hypothetical protein